MSQLVLVFHVRGRSNKGLYNIVLRTKEPRDETEKQSNPLSQRIIHGTGESRSSSPSSEAKSLFTFNCEQRLFSYLSQDAVSKIRVSERRTVIKCSRDCARYNWSVRVHCGAIKHFALRHQFEHTQFSFWTLLTSRSMRNFCKLACLVRVGKMLNSFFGPQTDRKKKSDQPSPMAWLACDRCYRC